MSMMGSFDDVIEDDLLERTVTYTNDLGNIKVTRTRDSSGFSSIKIQVDDEYHSGVEIEFSTDTHSNMYEQRARELYELIDKAVMNRCELPKETP